MSKGKGIIPIPAPREWVLAGGAQHAIDSGRAHVVQKYIDRPYLLDGFKSEVRLYFLVASVVPLKLLWYTEGSVRLAAQRFEAGQWDNPLVHIVNTAQGKRVLGKQRYAKFVADSPRKWSFAKMASHLQKNVTAGRNPWQHILSQMKRAIGIVLRAAAPHMQDATQKREKKWHAFALMAADFLLDTDLKPWLTEIQEGPGLSHLAEAVKEDFVPTMVAESARIGKLVAVRLQHGQSIAGVENGTHFREILQ